MFMTLTVGIPEYVPIRFMRVHAQLAPAGLSQAAS